MKLAMVSDSASVQGRVAIRHLLDVVQEDASALSVGYIASSPDPQRTFFKKTVSFYRSLGIENLLYVDLEMGYDEALMNGVFEKTIIHLSGGNTYRFLYWLKRRSLAAKLRDFALSGKPMVGVSAGAMLLTPSIETAAFCGDKNEVDLSDCSALSVTPFLFCAHARHNGKELALAEQICAEHGRQVVMCRDTDALYFNGEAVTPFGKPLWFS